jgi:hypothetical protein
MIAFLSLFSPRRGLAFQDARLEAEIVLLRHQ